MKYKYKEGDRVRIKPGADLECLGILNDALITVLKTGEHTITDATPGHEDWFNPLFDGKPTYSVDVDGWRIPESYLILEGEEKQPDTSPKFKVGDTVRIIELFLLPHLVGEEVTVTQIGGISNKSGVVVTGDDIPCGHESYGEHGMWIPDDWIELV